MDAPHAPLQHLVHSFTDGVEFLDHFSTEGGRERLFLPGVTTLQAGDQLDLEVRFKHSGYTFHSLAQVLLRRLAGRGSELQVGTQVTLVGSPSRSLMVAHARGSSIQYQLRSNQRVACHFPVVLIHRRERSVAEAVDYCPGGIQLLGGPLLEVGDAVQLRLHPVGTFLGLGLLGQVVWVQRQPELAYGISLKPSGNILRRRLQKLYERLLARRLS